MATKKTPKAAAAAKPKKGRGRPAGPKRLTAEMVQRVAQHIADGNTFENSLRLSGVGVSTGYVWQHQGREEITAREAGERGGEPSLYELFVTSKDEAEALNEAVHLENIRNKAMGALGDWKASAWMLERKYPDRYGKRLQVAGDQNAPLQVEQKAQIVLYMPDNGRDTPKE